MTLRELRAVTGISRAELERRAGLAPRTLERYENGTVQQNHLGIMEAYKISRVLKCKMEDLLELEDEKK